VDQREAAAQAGWLNLEHPDRAAFEWVTLPSGPDKWVVVKTIRRKRVDPMKPTTEAAPRPPQPQEPWSGPLGDLPGYR
jgi:hypothetical protein